MCTANTEKKKLLMTVLFSGWTSDLRHAGKPAMFPCVLAGYSDTELRLNINHTACWKQCIANVTLGPTCFHLWLYPSIRLQSAFAYDREREKI